MVIVIPPCFLGLVVLGGVVLFLLVVRCLGLEGKIMHGLVRRVPLPHSFFSVYIRRFCLPPFFLFDTSRLADWHLDG